MYFCEGKTVFYEEEGLEHGVLGRIRIWAIEIDSAGTSYLMSTKIT